jgi:Na+/H+ antiporter NhaD/arsenite permease-like protein
MLLSGDLSYTLIKSKRAMFKYLFYRIFRFQYKVIGEDRNMAALSSILSISFLIAMNIASIWFYFEKQTDLLNQIVDSINSFWGTNKATPIAFATIVLIPVYFIFYHKKKYERIIEEIENEDKQKNKVKNILAILYQIITIVVFLILFFS